MHITQFAQSEFATCSSEIPNDSYGLS